MKEKKNVKNKRIQFSQKVVVCSMTLIPICIFGNFILSWFEKETLSDMVIAVISSFSAFITGGYFCLSGARDCSKNKYNVTIGDEGDG